MIRYASLEFPAPLAAPAFAALLRALPPPLRAEVLRYRRWQDQHAALLGKLLVGHLLSGFGHPATALGTLYRDALGKPRLPARPDFSISHSGTVVACAMSDAHPVGLDVEQLRAYELDDFRACLRPDELLALRGTTHAASAFCQLWTQKESFVKAKGVGLVSGLQLQDVYIDGGHCHYRPPGQPAEHWHYYPLPVAAGYVATLCAPAPDLCLEPAPADLAALLRAAAPWGPAEEPLPLRLAS